MSQARSPVLTHVSSSLVGLTTIRAHQSQVLFQKIYDGLQDEHSSTSFMYMATTHWLGIWLDLIWAVYVACVTFVCVVLRDCKFILVFLFLVKFNFLNYCLKAISSSQVGLVIHSVITLMDDFQWCVRQSAEVESQMTSVERVIEFSQLKPEAAAFQPVEGMNTHFYFRYNFIVCILYSKVK